MEVTLREALVKVHPQCPLCYSSLEEREVTPCFVCGGWPGMVERFTPEAVFRQWRLPDGRSLMLCKGCELEEFMVPGGLGYRLGLGVGRLPIDDLQAIGSVSSPALGKDKYCPNCRLRLSLLKVIASSGAGADA